MRMAGRGRGCAAGALSLALLTVAGVASSNSDVATRTQVGYAVRPAYGIPAALPPPVVSPPRLAFSDDSDRVELATPNPSPGDRLSRGDHTGESTGAELRQRGQEAVLVATHDEPHGEIYLEINGSLDRLTCNTAVETHPELSRNGRMVAYSSNETGEEHLWVAWPYGRTDPDNWTPMPCAQMDREPLTKAPGRDVWPSWLNDTRLMFSSTRSDPLGDIWTIPVSAAGAADPDRQARRLTDGPAAETQPEAVGVPIGDAVPIPTDTSTGIDLAPRAPRAARGARAPLDGGPESRHGVIFTTTEYRTDGSLGVIQLDDSGTFDVRPVSSLWPGAPPQSSEADYGDSKPPFDRRLNYTTTETDQAGDVEYAGLTAPSAGGFTATRRGAVAQQLDRTETHGSHYESNAGMFGSYTIRSQAADVSDVVAADGSARRVVVSADPQEQTDERSPSYSPDGTRVAYSRRTDDGGSEIVVAAAEGSGPVALVPGRPTQEIQQEPAWSPDGTRIAFVGQTLALDSDGYGRRTIRVADVATGAVTALGPDLYDTVYDESPSWSPDSTRLVFARRDISIAQTVLLVADARTGSSVPLEGPDGWVCEGCVPGLRGRVPAWSPDGLRIAYDDRGTVRVAHLRDADGNGHPDIPEVATSVDAVTGYVDEQRREATPSRPVLAAATDPAWSPDGTELAVAGQPTMVPDQAGIYALRPDGTGLRTIAQDRGPETEPAWQPYGDLGVTVTSTAAQLATGGSATLTATVTNSGPNPAADVVLTLDVDGLAAGAAPTGCSLAGSVLTCHLGTVGPGASDVRPLPVVGPAARINLVATSVQSPTPDSRPDNNVAQLTVGVADVPVVAQPDLTVTLTYGGTGFVAGSGYVGGTGQAIVTVTNAGLVTGTGVTVTTALPAGLAKATSTPDCLAQGAPCALPDLPPGQSRAIVADLAFTQAGSGAGTATVSGTLPDSAPGNNTTSTQLTVKAPTLTLSPQVLPPGGVTVVRGSDFPPGVDVVLAWSAGITEPQGPVHAGLDGLIPPVQVFVFRRDQVGPRDLTATATFPNVMNPATQRLLVTPQRLAPPDFLVRS